MVTITESLKKFIDGSPDYTLPNDCPYISGYGLYNYPFEGEELSINSNLLYLGVDTLYGSPIKNIDFSNATQLYAIDTSCFYNAKIKNIILPPNIISLGDRIFSSCSNLKSVLIPSSIKYMPSNISPNNPSTFIFTICIDKPENSISGAPWGATNAVVIWNDKPAVFVKTRYDFDVYIKINGEYIEQRGIVGNEGDIVEIRLDKDGYEPYEFTFTLTDKLTIYDIDIELVEMGLYERVIQNENITSFTFDSDVTYLSGGCFYNSKLETVDFSNCVNLTHIGQECFSMCSSLTTIDLSNCISLQSLGYGTFWSCNALQNIKLPSNLSIIDSCCFQHCYALSEITIPSSVTSIGDYCFSGCSNLTTIDLPSSLTSLGSWCFGSCYALSEITIPSSVTSIGGYCFNGCGNLTTIDLSNCVQLTSIGNWCFMGCSSLSEITIPSSVTSIGNYCFSSCDNLTTITINKPQDSISGAPWGAPNATVVWNG